MSSNAEQIAFFRSLPSIRERCNAVFALAEADQLDFWSVDLSKQDSIVDFVCELIARDYGTNYDSIPPHGRARHFVGNRVDPLLAAWKAASVPELEVARRLLDLMVVSVLVDAGAGSTWKFKAKDGESIARSEGLAVASLEMFEQGFFSSIADQPCRVDADGLAKITTEQISASFQVSESNPMDGLDGRASLLIRLGAVISSPETAAYFVQDGVSRPGHIIDYLLAHPTSQKIPAANAHRIAVKMETLWEIVVEGLSGVWPAARTKIDGVSLGDVWPVESLGKANAGKEFGNLVPFHKLSQWLTYSLIEVMETTLSWKFVGKEQMTGLPEYRNGGLLIDYGLLVPKIPALQASFTPASTGTTLLELPPFHASYSSIVEFRAVTVVMLDRIADGIRTKLGVELSLPQVLESGTWKAGREVAKKLRPATAGPPFGIISDGTIF